MKNMAQTDIGKTFEEKMGSNNKTKKHQNRNVGHGDALAMQKLIQNSNLKFPQKNIQVLRDPCFNTLMNAM
jgi:hypothetical protein